MMRWQFVPLQVFGDLQPTAVTLEGIPWLPEKDELPLLWRFVWPWHVFLVEQKGRPWYYAYYQGRGHAMRSWTIRTPYVAVRIGPGDVDFAFVDVESGKPLPAELKTPHHPLRRRVVKREFKENITFV